MTNIQRRDDMFTQDKNVQDRLAAIEQILRNLTFGGNVDPPEGGPGSGGHIIQDEGTPLTQRPNLNFVGDGVEVTDDGVDTTTVTISGDTGGVSGPDLQGEVILAPYLGVGWESSDDPELWESARMYRDRDRVWFAGLLYFNGTVTGAIPDRPIDNLPLGYRPEDIRQVTMFTDPDNTEPTSPDTRNQFWTADITFAGRFLLDANKNFLASPNFGAPPHGTVLVLDGISYRMSQTADAMTTEGMPGGVGLQGPPGPQGPPGEPGAPGEGLDPLVVIAGNLGSTEALNCQGNHRVVLEGTLNTNCVLTLTNVPAGGEVILLLTNTVYNLTISHNGDSKGVPIPTGYSVVQIESPNSLDLYVSIGGGIEEELPGGGDTDPPSAPVLSATPGPNEMLLGWTFATDNVGVTEYEIWYDSTYVDAVTPGTSSYIVTGLTPGVNHNFRVVAYDAVRNYTNSNIVTAAATTGGGDPPGSGGSGTTYYVSNTGSDSANGTSEATAWQTVSKVNGFALLPGDTVRFKRGDQWNEALNITRSGTSTDPIWISAYGSGIDPIFDGGGNFANGNPLNATPGPWPTKGVREPMTLAGNWLIAEEFIVQQSSFAGFRVTGDDIIVRNFMTRWNVAGFFCTTASARYEIHNFECVDNAVMSVNAPGGDDDSGAFGMLVHGEDGEVHHGTSHGHRATSYDYGVDGSTCEVYGGKRNDIHHIIAWDDEAFSELGHASTEDTTFHHCVFYSLTQGNLIGFNIQGSPWGAPLRTKIHHCTIYLPAGSGNQGILFNSVTSWSGNTSFSVGTRRSPSLTNAKANGHIYEVVTAGTSSGVEPNWPTNGGTVNDGGVTWRDRGLQAEVYNNIVVASWKSGYFGMPGDENNNLYYGHNTQQIKSLNNANPIGNGVGTASKLGQNPLFVSTSTPDLHLQSGSPAVNAGVSKGYTTDFDDLPRAVGTPDMGAYERQ